MKQKETLGHAWQCGNCCYWIPNGSVLRVGYCRVEKFAYRKEAQVCKHFCPVPRIVMACYREGWTVERIAQEFGIDAKGVEAEIKVQEGKKC